MSCSPPFPAARVMFAVSNPPAANINVGIQGDFLLICRAIIFLMGGEGSVNEKKRGE
jgi:hypothetical protein